MNTVLATLETSGGSVIKRRKLNISLSTWPVFSFRIDFHQAPAPLCNLKIFVVTTSGQTLKHKE